MDEIYRLYTEYKSYSELKKLRFIISTIGKHYSQPRNVNILEVGCGKGNISLPLASIGYRVHGVDLDPNEIAYINQKNRFRNASFEVGDAEMLDISAWDVVICSEVFEHLTAPEKLLERLKEIVKPTGVLIVTIPNGYGPYELLYETPLRYAQAAIGKPEQFGHKQNYSYNGFTESLKESFTIAKVQHSNFMSFWPIIKKLSPVVKLDCSLADVLPPQLVSGWYFECRPKAQ